VASIRKPGMVNSISMLLMDVSDIDRATFPFNRYVIRFDVAPPGQIDINTIPILMAEGRSLRYAIVNAMPGSNIIWQHKPVMSALGSENISLKSSKCNDKPRLIIIRPSVTGKIYCENKLASILLNYYYKGSKIIVFGTME